MDRLRMAVIGVGHLGQHHARILANMADVDLVGVVDANVEQARAIATKFGTTPFGDIRPLVGKVDAVSVVTPTIHHHAVASTFLKAGVPVLVEKPICRTVAEADELIDLADKAGVPLQVGHIERFNPAFEELVKRPIRAKFVEAERHGPFTGRSVDIGAVLDLMIHDLDLLLALVGGKVMRVSAVGAVVFGGHEDMVNARLEFDNGCIAHVTASRITRHPKRRLRIWAPEGYAGIDFVTRKLALVQQSEEVRKHGLCVESLDPLSRARLKDEVFGRYLQVLNLDGDRKQDQLTAELRHFIDCVRTNTTPRVTGVDGRNALELAERVLDALRVHPWEGTPAGPHGPGGLPTPAGFLFPPIQLARPEAA
ncbi:Gfo/Idh/MocA family protein [Gemmata obscuriglobus]|uniref:Gfo/Idh/MocA family oxidoreductase n=1 Tax=Gemmata obscuriglobus TaxID=114 RepID=A0A2Z3H158_9BACT|nr:Gfo/Idh/MocA family oxidoreductase [Gemmata obscuriglobus]AWM37306.1 gfo/Idh/MocA family oxidoreductase [Gemmata obscuriglobus]